MNYTQIRKEIEREFEQEKEQGNIKETESVLNELGIEVL